MSEPANPGEFSPAADRLPLLWRRLKEHRIAQWTVGYVAIAYGIQHAVTLTSEAYEWPNIVTRLSMTLLALCLPLAITLSWYHGEKASRRVSGAELTIISLLLVTSSLLFAVLVHPAGITTPRAQEASVVAARVAAASPKGAISLAVLPFLDLSPAKDQDFFSDGMTEEITTALAKVPDLRVVGRTSAFQFKGANKDLRAIGQALSATHLIEGSVRKAGNRLRITAQLIKADDGTHIWAEDYDRELTDVFAIQEDIARAITASLHMTLGLKPGENLVNNRNIDPEAYTEYLRIRAGVTATETNAARGTALAELKKLVVREPEFAPARAYLALVRNRIVYGLWQTMWTRPLEQTRAMVDDMEGQLERDAREALRRDPGQADAYDALADIEQSRGRWAAAQDLIRKAAMLDPNNPEILTGEGALAMKTGNVQEGAKIAQLAVALDPLSPDRTLGGGMALLALNQPQAAIDYWEPRPDRRGVLLSMLAQAYAATGQFQKAADTIAASKGNPFYRTDPKSIDVAEALMRALAAKKPPPKVAHVQPPYNWIFAYWGEPERLLDQPEYAWRAGLIHRESFTFFLGTFAPVMKTERFKKLMRDVGLVDYWKARGWPERCHPTTGDDFACS